MKPAELVWPLLSFSETVPTPFENSLLSNSDLFQQLLAKKLVSKKPYPSPDSDEYCDTEKTLIFINNKGQKFLQKHRDVGFTVEEIIQGHRKYVQQFYHPMYMDVLLDCYWMLSSLSKLIPPLVIWSRPWSYWVENFVSLQKEIKYFKLINKRQKLSNLGHQFLQYFVNYSPVETFNRCLGRMPFYDKGSYFAQQSQAACLYLVRQIPFEEIGSLLVRLDPQIVPFVAHAARISSQLPSV